MKRVHTIDLRKTNRTNQKKTHQYCLESNYIYLAPLRYDFCKQIDQK